ncbi:MAG: hypothetical protein J6Y94_03765, partial [Bacteriovoracaceae bacterium]|nr:hypothetical protein [Bacteriovoracaceae bacterium]
MFRPNFLSHLLCLCFALGNSPSWAIETSISISPPSPTEFTATDHYFRPFVFPYVLNQISTTTSSSSPSAPPALIHVKLKIYDPIVQRQLLEKIRSCATLSPAQAQSVQDTVFAFLYGEMMGLQKAVPHWNDDRIFKTFSSLLHRLSPSSSFIINTEHPEFDLSHSTQTLEGFWHDYLGQEAHKPFIRFLARISKLDRENQKRLLTEFFHPAEQKRKPRNLPLTWQVYWDHYASQNFAGLYRYLSSQIVAHQPHLLDVGAYKIEFNGDGQVVAAIKNLLQEEEFQEFVRQLDLILRNDTEQIMRQYEINIF